MASKLSSLKSDEADVRSAISDSQAETPAGRFGQRLRDRSAELRISRSNLISWTGIPKQTFGGYWNGERLPPSETLLDLSEELDVSPRWLLTGTDRSPRSANSTLLRSAKDADWIEVPKYDLRNIDDTGLGEPTMIVPIRKDWLYANFRSSSDLWLANLLSDYRPAGLNEGAMVVCRSITETQLAQGHLCIWRVDGGIVVGRFSIVPEPGSARAILGGLPGDPRTDYAPDLIVPRSQIGGDGPYHLVGRILGVFLCPL